MGTRLRKCLRCTGIQKILLFISISLSFYIGMRYWSVYQLMTSTKLLKDKEQTLAINEKMATSLRLKQKVVENMTTSSRLKQQVVERKTILLYKNIIGEKTGHDVFDFSVCSVSDCRLSTHIDDLEASKVVIFNHVTLPKQPPKKSKFQWWVFTSSESPPLTIGTYKEPQWKNLFDWVMNYRHDSDFFFGYGDIIKKKEVDSKDYDEIYSTKTRDVAWIVSHCNTFSKRELYVNEMKKHIDIDIYGKCGSIKSCKTYTGFEDDTCHEMVGRKYKFYLSFENIFCKYYTTEKLYFAFAYDKNVIPVVRGAPNSKEYLPKDAMIFTEDFKSPKELAAYLKELGSNKSKYIEFLKRKDKYASKSSPQTLNETFCTMCKKLQSLEESQRRVFDAVDFLTTNVCREPTDLNFSKTN